MFYNHKHLGRESIKQTNITTESSPQNMGQAPTPCLNHLTRLMFSTEDSSSITLLGGGPGCSWRYPIPIHFLIVHVNVLTIWIGVDDQGSLFNVMIIIWILCLPGRFDPARHSLSALNVFSGMFEHLRSHLWSRASTDQLALRVNINDDIGNKEKYREGQLHMSCGRKIPPGNNQSRETKKTY